MISEWKNHDEASLRLKLSFAEDIQKRVENLENIVKPPSHHNDGKESAKELSQRMHTLSADVTDIGNRLERIECLLMCSNLSHVREIDNLLRQLKDNVVKGAVEKEHEDVTGKLGSGIVTCDVDLHQPDCILKVWPSYDLSEIEDIASSANLEPEPENDFVPSRNKQDDLIAISSCAHDSMKLRPDGMEPISKNAHPKQLTSAGERVASSSCVEQGASTKPRRFWRDEQGVERSSEISSAGSATQQSQGLTFDMFGQRLCKEQPLTRKQSRSRGWNLKAEAASSGKRIVPKS